MSKNLSAEYYQETTKKLVKGIKIFLNMKKKKAKIWS